MQGNRSRDTVPELAVRRILHASGYRYRVCIRPVPSLRRTADIVFTRWRIAIFIDGCFWHACPAHYVQPRANTEYWSPKIAGNLKRDTDTNGKLREADWIVARYWSHDAPEDIAARIIDLVRATRADVLGL
jgi:DNA mismatch endonuclease (patch repair protein)